MEILNPFLGKQTDDDKLSILLFIATDEHSRRLNIEMQTFVFVRSRGTKQLFDRSPESFVLHQILTLR